MRGITFCYKALLSVGLATLCVSVLDGKQLPFFLAARYIKGRRVFDYGWASLLGLGPQRESFDTLRCYSGLDCFSFYA